jgi:hypothetical protein
VRRRPDGCSLPSASGRPGCSLSRARWSSPRTASPLRARRSVTSALLWRMSGVPDLYWPERSAVGLAARSVLSCVEVQGHLLPRRADVVFPVRSRRSTRRVLGCS